MSYKRWRRRASRISNFKCDRASFASRTGVGSTGDGLMLQRATEATMGGHAFAPPGGRVGGTACPGLRRVSRLWMHAFGHGADYFRRLVRWDSARRDGTQLRRARWRARGECGAARVDLGRSEFSSLGYSAGGRLASTERRGAPVGGEPPFFSFFSFFLFFSFFPRHCGVDGGADAETGANWEAEGWATTWWRSEIRGG